MWISPGVQALLAICVIPYVEKANCGHCGVGPEKMILTGQLMRDAIADRIILVVSKNVLAQSLRTFFVNAMSHKLP